MPVISMRASRFRDTLCLLTETSASMVDMEASEMDDDQERSGRLPLLAMEQSWRTARRTRSLLS